MSKELKTRREELVRGFTLKYYGFIYTQVDRMFRRVSDQDKDDGIQKFFEKVICGPKPTVEELEELVSTEMHRHVLRGIEWRIIEILRKNKRLGTNNEKYGTSRIERNEDSYRYFGENGDATQKEKMWAWAKANLDTEDMDIFRRRFGIAQQSYKAIAEALGMKESTVRGRIARIKKRAIQDLDED